MKWVCAGKQSAVRISAVEYLQNRVGDFAWVVLDE
jgi:hypothetical protein